MLFLAATPLIAAIALILLAILVRAKAPRGELNEAFVFVVTMMCFWNLNFYILYSVKDHALAVTLSRTLRTGTLFLPPAILHLHMLLALGERTTLRWKPLLWLDYLAGSILAIANAFDLLVKDLRFADWGFASVGTEYYNVFTVFMLANAIASLGIVSIQFSRAQDARTRQQLRFWLAGAVIALPLGLMNLLPAYGVSIYPPGNLGTAVWAGIVAYAVIRHRLLGFEVVVTKTLAYVAVTTFLISPVFAISLAMQKLAFGSVHLDFSIGLFLLLVVVGVLFPQTRAWAEGRFERSLFSEKMAAHQALSAFAQSVIRLFDKKRIFRELCNVVANAFGTKSVQLFIASPENKRRLLLREFIGEEAPVSEISTESRLIRTLVAAGGPMLRSEVQPENTISGPEGGSALELQDWWDAIVPLLGPSGIVGILFLGGKRSREAYSTGDLEILERVGAEATFALENARLYEELRRSQQLIDRAGRLSALGTLAAGIAHEIRNPLVSIQTFFQLAPKRLQDEEFMTSFLGLAEEEVERIRSLISELLSFARTSEPTMRETVVQEVVSRTLTLMAPQAREGRVNLVATGQPSGPVIIQVDPDQLVQVLINLVLNAIQATPAGGKVGVRVSLLERNEMDFCEITVSDTGPGIPQDMRESIFNPFFTTKEAGTGLGLAIAYRIISDYGGNIVVRSDATGGAQFGVQLPLVSAIEGEAKRVEVA